MIARELGGPKVLKAEEIASPEPGPGQILVRVRACGVNFADSLVLKGKYQVQPDLPFAPGAEVAGTVLKLGEGVSGLKVGQRVAGMCGNGGYAEEALMPASGVVPLPVEMPDEVAAAFPIAYGTSHLALKHRGRLKKGETLVVHGAAGGVGLTAVEIGKALGARVIATASTPEKLEIARKHGADELVDSSTEDLRERIKGLTGGKGADVIYDPVGGDVFDASLRAIAFEGRLIVIGFAGGRVPQIPANHLMVKNVDAIGFNFGAYLEKAPAVTREAFSELAGWYVEGRIRPYVSDRFTLEETPAAIAHVMERRARGKAVVLVP
ncbi:NADPH:quinone oxidoreductase family protein [Parvibaculum sp.]|nr:NADPH:quinone oxidoreductase family protein [Parvibaculum sp.]